jgi:hypothetical protein
MLRLDHYPVAARHPGAAVAQVIREPLLVQDPPGSRDQLAQFTFGGAAVMSSLTCHLDLTII